MRKGFHWLGFSAILGALPVLIVAGWFWLDHQPAATAAAALRHAAEQGQLYILASVISAGAAGELLRSPNKQSFASSLASLAAIVLAIGSAATYGRLTLFNPLDDVERYLVLSYGMYAGAAMVGVMCVVVAEWE